MIGRVAVVGARAVELQFSAAAKVAPARVQRTVRQQGSLLLTRVRAGASGRPGPRAQTGDYRRSWGMQVVQFGDQTSVFVGTNAPQGRRLEFGFKGADRIGRVYDQPPFPHVQPAYAKTEASFNAAMTKIADQVVGG